MWLTAELHCTVFGTKISEPKLTNKHFWTIASMRWICGINTVLRSLPTFFFTATPHFRPPTYLRKSLTQITRPLLPKKHVSDCDWWLLCYGFVLTVCHPTLLLVLLFASIVGTCPEAPAPMHLGRLIITVKFDKLLWKLKKKTKETGGQTSRGSLFSDTKRQMRVTDKV